MADGQITDNGIDTTDAHGAYQWLRDVQEVEAPNDTQLLYFLSNYQLPNA